MKSRDILVVEDLNLYALNTFGEKDLALLRNINFKLGPREILGACRRNRGGQITIDKRNWKKPGLQLKTHRGSIALPLQR